MSPPSTGPDKAGFGVCTKPAGRIASVPKNLEYRVTLDLGSARGCSRSHASRDLDGTMSLAVEADDRAVMTVQLEGGSVFGPSLGAFRAGERDFQHTSERMRRTWSGVAWRCGDQLKVRFSELAVAEDHRRSSEDAGLPAPTTQPSALTLNCRVESIRAYRLSDPTASLVRIEGEPKEEIDVLLCEPSEAPFELWELAQVKKGIPLLEHGDLVVVGSERQFGKQLRIGVAR